MIYEFTATTPEEKSIFDNRLKICERWSKLTTLTTKDIYRKRENNFLDTKKMIQQHAHSKMGEFLIQKFLESKNIKIKEGTDFKIYCNENEIKDLLKLDPGAKNLLITTKNKDFSYDMVLERYNLHIKIQDNESRNKLGVASWVHQIGDSFLNRIIPEKDVSVLGYLDVVKRNFIIEWMVYTHQIKKFDLLQSLLNGNKTKKAIYATSPKYTYRKNIAEEIDKGNITPLTLEQL